MSESDFEEHSWAAFCEATSTRGPLEYLHSAIEYVEGNVGAGRQAIDVGSGGGADARDLLSRGWKVCAIDSEPASRRLLEERTPPGHRDGLVIVTAPSTRLSCHPQTSHTPSSRFRSQAVDSKNPWTMCLRR
jgi:hypothetical protein